jgi:hypothetical protein
MPITPRVIDNPMARRNSIIPKETPFNRFIVIRSIAESAFAIISPVLLTLFFYLENNKEPRPQGGASKPKFSKPKTEIPKSIDPELASGPGSG